MFFNNKKLLKMIGLYEKLCIIIGMVKNNKTNNKKN
jgi:hypothetical protein